MDSACENWDVIGNSKRRKMNLSLDVVVDEFAE